MAFPEYEQIETPLLLYIFEAGAPSYEVQASDTYGPLADRFGLSERERQMTRDEVHGDGREEPAWNNMVQWARRKLNDRGFLAASRHGYWKLSSRGIEEARRRLSASRPN